MYLTWTLVDISLTMYVCLSVHVVCECPLGYSRTVNSFATQVACNRGIWKLLRRTHATHLKPPLPETCVACKFPSCDTNSRNLSMQKKLPPFCCCHIKMGYIFFFMYPLLMKLDPLLSKYKTNSYHKVLEPLHMIVVIRRGGKSI